MAMRRYLIYDMAVLNSQPIVTKEWLKRFIDIDHQVVGPRQRERK